MGIDTAWKKTIATFMNVGGSVGPVGTRWKNGLVAHLINTYVMKARITAPRPPTISREPIGVVPVKPRSG